MNARKAIFLDRDGVINQEQSYICSADEFIVLPQVPRAIKRINQSGFLVVVITNQSAIAQGMLSEDTLTHIHTKMTDLLAQEGAVLDGIYYCPHHPNVSACTCRKPQNGMLLQAQKNLNIDFEGSWMIGDHGRDLECGKSVGLRTIAIGTASTWIYETKPDYFFESLIEAVGFILE